MTGRQFYGEISWKTLRGDERYKKKYVEIGTTQSKYKPMRKRRQTRHKSGEMSSISQNNTENQFELTKQLIK